MSPRRLEQTGSSGTTGDARRVLAFVATPAGAPVPPVRLWTVKIRCGSVVGDVWGAVDPKIQILKIPRRNRLSSLAGDPPPTDPAPEHHDRIARVLVDHTAATLWCERADDLTGLEGYEPL